VCVFVEKKKEVWVELGITARVEDSQSSQRRSGKERQREEEQGKEKKTHRTEKWG